ncbi:MAG: hypothetical protein ABIX37_04405 [Gammaproteobacteria bacterium]
MLPISVVAALISDLGQGLLAGLMDVKPGELPTGPLLGTGTIGSIAVIFVLSVVSWAVLLAGIDQSARTGRSPIRDALGIGIRRSPAALATAILATLALVAGFVLLVIPGMYLMVVLYPVFILPIAEQLGPWRSMQRAYDLVTGSWWRTATVITVLGLVVVAVFALASVLGGLAAVPFIDNDNAEAALEVALVVQVVVSLLLSPLLPLPYCMMYALYTDLRLRKDGADLLERAAAARV